MLIITMQHQGPITNCCSDKCLNTATTSLPHPITDSQPILVYSFNS